MIDQSSWITKSDFYKEYCKLPFEVICNEKTYNKKAEVEVMVVTYNQKKYIKEALDSILIQKTNFEFNIQICDDASSDGTTEICKEYQAKFPEKIKLYINSRLNNIKILGKPCGIHSMVHGFLSLSSPYFALLSGDDYWTDESKLQKQFDFLENNKEYVSCFHPYVHKNEDSGQLSSKLQTGHMPLTHFARNVFNKVPKEFLEVLQEDTFLKALLSEYGKFGFLKEIKPSVYRMHGTNIWGDENSSFKWESRLLTNDKIYNVFSKSKNKLKHQNQLLESIVGKDDFMVQIKKRKFKRISLAFYKDLMKYQVFILFSKKVINNKFSIVKK
jgi:glycosyltransferase involved in cell wall biosynthesis